LTFDFEDSDFCVTLLKGWEQS